MKYTKVLTLVLGFGMAPLFAMEQGYKSEVKPSQNRRTVSANVAFTVSGFINEFNTPLTVINLKEANAEYVDDNMVMHPEYVRQIPAEIIQNYSIILPGTEEVHKLQNPLVINYPSKKDGFTGLVIVAADKLIEIWVDRKTSIVEIDQKGDSSEYSEFAFNNGDTFMIKVARDGKVTLEKSQEQKIENKEEKKAENKQVTEATQIKLNFLEKQTLINSALAGLKNIQNAPYEKLSEAVSSMIQTLMESAELYKQTIGSQGYEATINKLLKAMETKTVYQNVLMLIAAFETDLKVLKKEYANEPLTNYF